MVISLLVWGALPAQADQINNKVEEKIEASTNYDGKIEVIWQGEPGPEGTVILPQPTLEAKWLQTEVTGAVIEELKPKEIKDGDKKWYQWNVKDANESKEITLKINYLVPGLFKETESNEVDLEGGPTSRGGLRNFSYNFENNTPYVIGEYTCTIILPPGYEVFQVSSPKTFKLKDNQNSKSIIVKMSSKKEGTPAVPIGSSVSIEFQYVKSLTPVQIGIFWIVSGLIAGIFLYYRRSLVSLSSNKKT